MSSNWKLNTVYLLIIQMLTFFRSIFQDCPFAVVYGQRTWRQLGRQLRQYRSDFCWKWFSCKSLKLSIFWSNKFLNFEDQIILFYFDDRRSALRVRGGPGWDLQTSVGVWCQAGRAQSGGGDPDPNGQTGSRSGRDEDDRIWRFLKSNPDWPLFSTSQLKWILYCFV